MYTEHQKELITSLERHSLKSTASKSIINHLWIHISYTMCDKTKKKSGMLDFRYFGIREYNIF